MYSAEIAGDEEDEKEAAKNAALSEEELAAKKAKEAKQFQWLLYMNCGNFNHIFCGCIYVATVCTGQSASEGWSLRVWRNSSRSIREARAFPGIYVSDFQNEGYSENIYVSRCRA